MKAAKDGYEHGKGKSLILIDTEWFLVSGFWFLESGIWNLEPRTPLLVIEQATRAGITCQSQSMNYWILLQHFTRHQRFFFFILFMSLHISESNNLNVLGAVIAIAKQLTINYYAVLSESL